MSIRIYSVLIHKFTVLLRVYKAKFTKSNDDINFVLVTKQHRIIILTGINLSGGGNLLNLLYIWGEKGGVSHYG
jgi:hypothetical protein